MSIVYISARRDHAPDPAVGRLAIHEGESLTLPTIRAAHPSAYVLVEVLDDGAEEAIDGWLEATTGEDDPDTLAPVEDTAAAERLLDHFCGGEPAAAVSVPGRLQRLAASIQQVARLISQCQHPSCNHLFVDTTDSTREDMIDSARALGWRINTDTGCVRCPTHWSECQ